MATLPLQEVVKRLRNIEIAIDRLGTRERAAAGGGGTVVPHPLPVSGGWHTGTLPWGDLNKTGSNLADLATRNYGDLNLRQHNIVGADHIIAAAPWSVVGATEPTGDLGTLLARSVASGPIYETILKTDVAGGLELVTLTATTEVVTGQLRAPGALSILNAGISNDIIITPSRHLVLEYNRRFQSNGANLIGYLGNGFGIWTDAISGKAKMEADELTVRGRMNVYELVIRQIRSTNGNLLVTSASKADTVTLLTGVSGAINSTYTITVEDNTYHGFFPDDLIKAQRWRFDGAVGVPGKATIFIAEMTVLTTPTLTTYTARLDDGDAPQAGWDFVRHGNRTDVDRQGMIGIMADDTNSPFIAIINGVNDWTDWFSGTKLKGLIGNLTGSAIGGLPDPLTGYEYGMVFGTGWTNADSYVKISNRVALFNKINAHWYNGLYETVTIEATGNMEMGLDLAFDAKTSFVFTAATGILALGRKDTPAITFNGTTGASYFTGIMTLANTAEIRQGVSTAGDVQTDAFASLTAYTGFRLWSINAYSGQVGLMAGYNTGVAQWAASVDGRIFIGNVTDVGVVDGSNLPLTTGDTILSARGVTLKSVTGASDASDTLAGTSRGIRWYDNPITDTNPVASILGGKDAGGFPFVTVNLRTGGSNVASLGLYQAGGVVQAWFEGIDTVVGIPAFFATNSPGGGFDAGVFFGVNASTDDHVFEIRDNVFTSINTDWLPTVSDTWDLGTPGLRWNNVYVKTITADTITGTVALGGQTWQYNTGDMYIISTFAADRTLYIANNDPGFRMDLNVEGDIIVGPGRTVDGVDMSAFYAAFGATSIIAGDGLVGGGTLGGPVTLDVGAGVLIDIDTNSVGIADAPAAYYVIGSGADTVAEWVNMSTLKGDGLTYLTGVLTLGTPTILGVASTNAVTASSHTHSLDWSSNPGAASKILGTTAAGDLTLASLSVGRILAGNGTAALPAYSFSSDPNTGMFSFSGDYLGLSAGGAARMYVTSSFVQFTVLISGVNGTAVNPAYAFSGDAGMGLYRSAAGVLGLTAAGTGRVLISATDTQFTTVVLGVDGAAAAPTYAFSGQPSLGMYASGMGTLGFATASTLRVSFSASRAQFMVPIAATDGTAAAPAYTFTNELDTGMYLAGANTLGFSAAGVNTISITSAAATFAVPIAAQNGTAVAPAYAFASDLDTGIYRYGVNSIGFATGGTTPFTIDGAFANLTVTLGGTYAQFSNDVAADRFMIAFGSALLPGFTFVGDQDTGWYWENANVFGLTTGGATRATFSNTATQFFTPIVPIDGLEATPSLYFASDPDSGFYWTGDGSISVTTNASRILSFEDSSIEIYGNLNVTGVADVTTQVNTPLITSTAVMTITPGTYAVLSDNKALRSSTFVSGFAGSGFVLDNGNIYTDKTYLEVDNLTVRGLMNIYELVIQKIRSTNGNIFVSSTFKVIIDPVLLTGVFGDPGSTYTITADADSGNNLAIGDLIRAQRWLNGASVIQSNLEVTGISGLEATVTLISGSATLPLTPAPLMGYEYARLGNISDANRQGGLYLSSDDAGSPFMDVWNGVDAFGDWNSTGTVKVRVGRLDGVTTASNEYGLIAGNTGFGDADAYVKVSNLGVRMNNIPIQMWSGGVNTGLWEANGSISASDVSVTTVANRVMYMDTATGDFRIGKIGASLSNLIWSAGTLTLNNNTTPMVTISTTGVVTVGPKLASRSRIVIGAASGVSMLWSNASNVDQTPVFNLDNAGNATFAGTVTATAGLIGNWVINSTNLANAAVSPNIVLYSGAAGTARIEVGTGTTLGGINAASTATIAETGVVFWAGDTYANRNTADFRVYTTGAMYAASGDIGGWVINTTNLRNSTSNIFLYSGAIGTARIEVGSAANTGGINVPNVGTDTIHGVVFWAGDTYANRNTADFRVYTTGNMYAEGATLTSADVTGDITADTLTANTSGSIAGWTIAATRLYSASGNISTYSGIDGVARFEVINGLSAHGGISTITNTAHSIFWAGNTFANKNTAPFRVDGNGKIWGNIEGGITATSGIASGTFEFNALAQFDGAVELNNIMTDGATSARIRLSAGTAASVPFSTNGNGNGMYSPSANAVAISTGGTLAATFSSVGALTTVGAITSGSVFYATAGGAAAPGYSFSGITNAGLFATSDYVGIAKGGNVVLISRTEANTSYIALGVGNTNSAASSYFMYTNGLTPTTATASVARAAGANGVFNFGQTGTGAIGFYHGASPAVTINSDLNVTFYGELYGPNGTAAIPTFNFTSLGNMGMYRYDASHIGFSAVGVVRAAIGSGGIYAYYGVGLNDGSVASPSLRFTSNGDNGLYLVSTDSMSYAANGRQVATFTLTGGRALLAVNTGAAASGAAGPALLVGYNNFSVAAGGAGFLSLANRTGVAYRFWVSNGNVFRFNTADPTFANDNAGTAIITFASSLAVKDILGRPDDALTVMGHLRTGAESVRRFMYKAFNEESDRPFGSDNFSGIIIDYATRYGMDNGKSLNVFTAIGDLMIGTNHLHDRIISLEAEVATLKRQLATIQGD